MLPTSVLRYDSKKISSLIPTFRNLAGTVPPKMNNTTTHNDTPQTILRLYYYRERGMRE
jgi:hypothetical protein